MPLTVAEIAAKIGATVEGDGATKLNGVSTFEQAGPGDLVFAQSPRYGERAARSRAGAVIAPPGAEIPGKTVLRHLYPKAAFARAIAALLPPVRPAPGVHPSASVAPGVQLGREVHVGALASVGAGARIGDRTVLHAGVIVGEGAKIGADCTLEPRSVVYPGCTLGDRVFLKAGAIIGAAGFGFVQEGEIPGEDDLEPGQEVLDYRRYFQREGPHIRVPQVGTVILGDDVEIGANSCVDRGTLGPTVIGRGTKVDNLTQIAHNVVIGEHCLVASLTGLSGSTSLGSHVTIGGHVGIAEGAQIGDRVLVAAKAGISTGKKLPPGTGWVGIPARPGEKGLRILAASTAVPTIAETVKRLRVRVAALEKALAGGARVEKK
ncbi:MAG: UDP-3-O-(3-hydroxymyristoyl)glucosamine N-acyltransferase [Planctomycetales bacterium]|nr:UDP-3-O-(3-hydroxymyristoyl)glucosamine N-acyltransferase [Planctomycetales bacterium]